MSAILAEARQWINTPWQHGASLRGQGTDCLGLIRGVLREVTGQDFALPPYDVGWYVVDRTEPLLNGLRRYLLQAKEDWLLGDILAFRMKPSVSVRHLGILSAQLPEPSFIHCLQRRGVVDVSLSAPWRARVAARFRLPDNLQKEIC